jgi:ankyrin repeat protein
MAALLLELGAKGDVEMLEQAAVYGFEEVALLLVNNGVSPLPTESSIKRRLVLCDAIERKMWKLVAVVMDIFRAAPRNPEQADAERSALLSAIYARNESLALAMLEAGFHKPYRAMADKSKDSMSVDGGDDGDSEECSEDAAEERLEKPAPVSDNRHAVEVAVAKKMVAAVKALLPRKLDMSGDDNEDGSWWLQVLLKGELEKSNMVPELAKVLLDAGCSPLARDRHGRTPLLEAVANGEAATVEVLVKASGDRFDLSHMDINGKTILWELANRPKPHRAGILKVLLATDKIDVNAKVPAADRKGMRRVRWTSPLLVELCRAGDEDAALLLLDRPETNCNAQGGLNDTPALSVALEKRLVRVVSRLLQFSALDVNSRNALGETPLMAAVRANDSTAVQALIAKGAQLEVANSNGQTALMLGALLPKSNIVVALLDAGCQPDSRDLQGFTALQLALSRGKSKVAMALLKRGAQLIGANDRDEMTLLFKRKDVPAFADVAICLYDKICTESQYASRRLGEFYRDALALLVEFGREDLALAFWREHPYKSFCSSTLTKAVNRGMTRFALAVLDAQEVLRRKKGAWQDGFSRCLPGLLVMACKRQRVTIVRAVLALFCRHWDAVFGIFKVDCFTEAANNGDVATLKALMSLGVAERWPGLFSTVLSKSLVTAVTNSHAEAALFLLDYPDTHPDRFIHTSTKHWVLYMACERGLVAVVKKLLSRESKPNIEAVEPKKRLRALHVAAKMRHLECAEALLAAGALVDAQDSDGFTPLHHCLEDTAHDSTFYDHWGHEREKVKHKYSGSILRMLSLLLRHGADPNAHGAIQHGRRTALIVAAETTNYGAALRIMKESKVLVDFSRTDTEGHTVLDVALTEKASPVRMSRRRRPDIAGLLLEASNIPEGVVLQTLSTLMSEPSEGFKLQLARTLLAKGVNVNKTQCLFSLCSSLRYYDCRDEKIDLIRLFLDHGADPTRPRLDPDDGRLETVFDILEKREDKDRGASWRKAMAMLREAEAKVLQENAAKKKAEADAAASKKNGSAGAGGGTGRKKK